MKKIFNMLTAAFAVVVIMASGCTAIQVDDGTDEGAVKKTIYDVMNKQIDLDYKGSLTHCTMDYQEIDQARGYTATYGQYELLYAIFDKLMGRNDASLSWYDLIDLYEVYRQVYTSNSNIREQSATMKIRIRNLSTRDREGKMLKMMKDNLKKELTNGTVKKLKKTRKSMKFDSVVVNGNTATAIYTANDFDWNNRSYLARTTTTLVKVDGKWLIQKKITTGAK